MPSVDQHWFDTTVNIMKVWNGTRWLEKIRVFACKLIAGSVPISMSINAPLFDGTQAGITSPAPDFATGEILFDQTTGLPIITQNGYFVTSEDGLTTRDLSSTAVKIQGLIVSAQATTNIPAFTIVRFSDFGKIEPANAFTAGLGDVYGIIESSVVTDSFVNVKVEGAISNPSWDWSLVGINAPLYCDASGQIVTSPVIPEQVPVAVVVDKQTILVGTPQIRSTGVSVSPATTSTYGIVRLNIPPAVPGVPIVVGDNDLNLWDVTGAFNRWTTDTAGNFTAAGNVTAYSDKRLKTNIKPIENALEKVTSLTGVSFTRTDTKQQGIGLIAQDVQQVFPEVVVEAGDEQKTLSVAYGNLIGPLIEAIKVLSKQVDDLKQEIKHLKTPQ